MVMRGATVEKFESILVDGFINIIIIGLFSN